MYLIPYSFYISVSDFHRITLFCYSAILFFFVEREGINHNWLKRVSISSFFKGSDDKIKICFS